MLASSDSHIHNGVSGESNLVRSSFFLLAGFALLWDEFILIYSLRVSLCMKGRIKRTTMQLYLAALSCGVPIAVQLLRKNTELLLSSCNMKFYSHTRFCLSPEAWTGSCFNTPSVSFYLDSLSNIGDQTRLQSRFPVISWVNHHGNLCCAQIRDQRAIGWHHHLQTNQIESAFLDTKNTWLIKLTSLCDKLKRFFSPLSELLTFEWIQFKVSELQSAAVT